MNYKKKIAKLLQNEVELEISLIEDIIQIPLNRENGDYTFPCFQLSKKIKKSPITIAEELHSKIKNDGFEKIESKNGYLNFYINKGGFIRKTMTEILSKKESYGDSKIGEGRVICLDCPSENVEHLMEIDEFFNVVVQKCLYNLFIKQGYQVKVLKNKKEYAENLDYVINILKEKNILTKCNNAHVVMLESYNMAPCIISKDNKPNIEVINNLASVIKSKDKYKFYKYIYIAGVSQLSRFKQISKVLEVIEFNDVDGYVYAGNGIVKFNDRSVYSDENNRIIVNSLIRLSIERSLEFINENNQDLVNKDDIARNIGIGNIIFTCLKNSRQSNIIFDFAEALSTKHDAALYIQFCYLKISRLITNKKDIDMNIDFSKLQATTEIKLIEILDKFGDIIYKSMELCDPSIVIKYLIDIVKRFEEFYIDDKVVNKKDKSLIKARQVLMKSTMQVLKNTLELIGIEVLEPIYKI